VRTLLVEDLEEAVRLGRGHQYLNSALADAALGGWQASASWFVESGAPFIVIMNNNTPSGTFSS